MVGLKAAEKPTEDGLEAVGLEEVGSGAWGGLAHTAVWEGETATAARTEAVPVVSSSSKYMVDDVHVEVSRSLYMVTDM